jgi:hypothetical protein
LINVDDGYHLWSERYDREMEDVFVIQDDITQSIVKTIEPTNVVLVFDRLTASCDLKKSERFCPY